MSLPELLNNTRRNLEPAIDLSLGEGPATSGRTIPDYKQEFQKRDQWCWAAVAVSVSTFYDAASTWTQCTLVNAEFERTDCCLYGSPCNTFWYLDCALLRTGNLNRKVNAAATFHDLTHEINTNRPLGCRIQWPSGAGHFVVVHAYSSDGDSDWVSVADPWYGLGTYPYDTFLTNYLSTGTWTHSYYTLS